MTAITLPPDLEAWAEAEVAAGRASDVEALIAEIVREHRSLFDSHKALVLEAYAQVERGEALDEKEADAFIDALIG